jgi:hypothetical protein
MDKDDVKERCSQRIGMNINMIFASIDYENPPFRSPSLISMLLVSPVTVGRLRLSGDSKCLDPLYHKSGVQVSLRLVRISAP